MFYDFKRINDNQFEVIYKYNNARIKVLCSNIICRNYNIPFYVCNSKIKSDIQINHSSEYFQKYVYTKIADVFRIDNKEKHIHQTFNLGY